MNAATFVLGQVVGFEESRACEFKEVKGSPIQAIGRSVDEYVVAYLNTTEGSVYWGIRDRDRSVVGVRLDYPMRDELRQIIGQKVGSIAPPVPANCYDIPFHRVVRAPDDPTPVEDTYVVELAVRSPVGGGFYLTGSGEAYRKTDGGTKKLSGAELRMALLAELEVKLQGTPKSIESADLENASHMDVSRIPSVARRAQVVRPLLRDARVLWVDDNPMNNFYERSVLASLGVSVDLALSTEEALFMSTRLDYHLVLSDMKRASNSQAGLELLNELRDRGITSPIVFYCAQVNLHRGIPVGAFGITNRPDELLHSILDVLERRT